MVPEAGTRRFRGAMSRVLRAGVEGSSTFTDGVKRGTKAAGALEEGGVGGVFDAVAAMSLRELSEDYEDEEKCVS